MNIILYDDSKSNLNYLSSLILEFKNEYNENFLLLKYNSKQQLIDHYALIDSKPDIIFINTDLPSQNENGLSVANWIRFKLNDTSAKIIFISDNSNHVIDSFSVKPYNYLVHPISKEKLFAVLTNALISINHSQRPSLAVKSYHSNTINFLSIKTIKFIENIDSSKRLLNIHLDNQHTIKTLGYLNNYMSMFNNYDFFKISRTTIVNFAYIDYIKGAIFLTDGTKLRIAKSRVKIFEKKFNNYRAKKKYLN